MSDMNLGTLTAYLAIDASAVQPGINAARGQIRALGTQGAQDARQAGTTLGNSIVTGLGAALGSASIAPEMRQQLSQVERDAQAAGVQAGANLGQGINGQMQGAGSQAAQGFGSSFGGVLGSVIAGLGIGAMIGAAMADQDSTALLQVQLNLTTEQAARAGKLAGDLYAQNYGESIDAVKDVMREVGSSVGDLASMTDAELSSITKNAINLSRITGEESGRIVQQVGRLLKTGLATDATQAFDMITRASQGMSGELQGSMLDVVDEYSKDFAALGIAGPQAFGLIKAASKDGEIAMDKAGDAVKEFAIRATDMSTTSMAAYDTLGLSAQGMANQILAGGESSKSAFAQIVGGLNQIEDPADRANTAIALFGTPLEDLGVNQIPSFLKALGDAQGGLGDFEGAAADADATLGSVATGGVSSFMRSLERAGASLGQNLLPAIQPVIDLAGTLGEGIGAVVEGFSKLPGPVKAGILAFGAFVALRGPIGALITSMKSAIASGGGMTGMLGKLKTAAGVGVAFAGIGFIVDSFTKTMADNAAAAANTQKRHEDLAAALVASSGAWDDSVKAMLEASVVNDDFFKALQGAGLDYSTTMKALTGDTAAYGAAMVKLSENGDDASVMLMGQLMHYKNTQEAAKDSADQQLKYAEQSKIAAGALGRVNAETAEGNAKLMVHTGYAKDMTEAYKLMGVTAPDAMERTGTAASNTVAPVESVTDVVGRMREGYDAAVQTMDDFSGRVSKVIESLDQLAGRTPSVEQATADLNAEIRKMNSEWDPAQDGVQKLGAGILKASGEIKTGTEAGSKFRDATLDMREKMASAATAAYDQSVKMGDLAGAQDRAKAAADAGYDAFISNATAILGSKDAAEKAARAYGLIPSQVATSVRAETSQAAQTIYDFVNQPRVAWVQLKAANTAMGLSLAGGLTAQNANGGIVQAANGLVRQSMIARGGANILWAEPETGWEAYISGKSSQRARNQMLMVETAARLGGTYIPPGTKAFASGGSVGGLNLAGRPSASYGGRETDIRAALLGLKDVLRDVAIDSNEAREKAKEARSELAQARKEFRSLDKDASKSQVAAARRNVTLAEKDSRLADLRSAAAERNRRASEKAFDSQERARKLLISLGRAYDATSIKLEDAKDKLGSLRDQAYSLSSSISDGLKDTGGGLTGFAEQRNSPASIINGLGFNLKNVTAFEKQIMKLDKLGLSSNQLSLLAAQGFDGAGSTVATLSKASKAQIAQINKLVGQTGAAADRTGKFVAKDVFGASVTRQEKIVKGLTTDMRAFAERLSKIDDKISDAVQAGLSRAKVVLDPKGMAKLVVQGQAQMKRSK